MFLSLLPHNSRRMLTSIRTCFRSFNNFGSLHPPFPATLTNQNICSKITLMHGKAYRLSVLRLIQAACRCPPPSCPSLTYSSLRSSLCSLFLSIRSAKKSKKVTLIPPSPVHLHPEGACLQHTLLTTLYSLFSTPLPPPGFVSEE